MQRARSLGRRAGQPVQEPDPQDSVAEELPRGPGWGAGKVCELLLAPPQLPAEPTHVASIEATERSREQRLGAAGVDVLHVSAVLIVEVEHGAQRVEHGEHCRVARERDVVAGDFDGHPGGAECPAQARDRRPARPDQHRHVVPVDAVLEVCAAQQVSEVLGLCPLGLERHDLGPSLAQGASLSHGRKESLPCRGVDADRLGQPTGHPLGGHQQALAEAAGGAQGDDVGRIAVAAGKPGRELEDAPDLGTTEGVDRLVRIADDGEISAVPRERLQEADLGRVRVLVLVDEHMAQTSP